MRAIHHTPGRIRFKFAELQNQKPLANTVQHAIRRLDGVRLVQVNAITGSLLVHYELRGDREKALLSMIHGINDRLGLHTSSQLATDASTTLQLGRPAQANALVETFLERVFEKALERTAIALVSAFI